MPSLGHLHGLSCCDLSSNLKWSHLKALTRTQNGKQDKTNQWSVQARTHTNQLYAGKQSASAKLFILIKNKWYGCPALQPQACHSISMQIKLHGSLSIIPLWVAGRPCGWYRKGNPSRTEQCRRNESQNCPFIESEQASKSHFSHFVSLMYKPIICLSSESVVFLHSKISTNLLHIPPTIDEKFRSQQIHPTNLHGIKLKIH